MERRYARGGICETADAFRSVERARARMKVYGDYLRDHPEAQNRSLSIRCPAVGSPYVVVLPLTVADARRQLAAKVASF